jgi:hypothetical protein
MILLHNGLVHGVRPPRMHEEYDATDSNTKAIVAGSGRTGLLVTRAARFSSSPASH